MTTLELCESLSLEIQKAYEETVTIQEAEKLAARFLQAQMDITAELMRGDLDARMRKSGLKTVKAAIYMEAATKTDKKPSDVMLNAIVDMDTIVKAEQEAFDQAEVYRDALQNYFNIFNNAHIFFRGLAKGRFE